MLPESEEKQNKEAPPETIASADMESLQKALAEEKLKAENYLANWQRTQADFTNYKRRNEQEREESSKFAQADRLLGLLPVFDDLERALASVPPRLARLPWVDGIRLIERKFQNSLENQGLFQIKALGEPFDPKFHEAVRQDRGKEGIVIEEIRKGYKLYDQVIRPSLVVVGNGEETEKEEK